MTINQAMQAPCDALAVCDVPALLWQAFALAGSGSI